ncbi:hypothetical protein ACHAXR_009369 [Thalassiosira sp. AJA248-18]
MHWWKRMEAKLESR